MGNKAEVPISGIVAKDVSSIRMYKDTIDRIKGLEFEGTGRRRLSLDDKINLLIDLYESKN